MPFKIETAFVNNEVFDLIEPDDIIEALEAILPEATKLNGSVIVIVLETKVGI